MAEKIEDVAMNYVLAQRKDMLHGKDVPTPEMREYLTFSYKEMTEAFKAGYDYAITKACELLYEYNTQQAKAHGSKAVLGIREFTISVYDFKKALYPLDAL